MGDEKTPAASNPPTRVMIAVSRSTQGYPKPSISSTQAFEWALKKLLRPCCSKEFKLLILHVQVPDEDGYKDMDSMYATADDFKHLKVEERNEGLNLLEKFIKQCNEAGVECEGWLKQGDIKSTICEEVRRVHPDILVMGNRGLGTLQRMFVGGVSSYCMKNVDCPIIVIKRDPKSAPEDPMDD